MNTVPALAVVTAAYLMESVSFARIVGRMQSLAEIFAIDLCAYAVMSNHYHVVLHIDKVRVENWSEREICQRRHRLFKGSLLSQRYCREEVLTPAEEKALTEQTVQWRHRLMSVSWFMRCLNEHIARRANQEDDCTGRFWEGRFKCQALLDESALLACMAYVDLNPVRAGMANSPEESEYTSIHRRMAIFRSEADQHETANLMPFRNKSDLIPSNCLLFKLQDYLELLDWTGRAIRPDAHGTIPTDFPPIASQLKIESHAWLAMTKGF